MHACPKLKVLKPYMEKYLSVSSDMLDYVPELEVLGHICMSGETLKGTGPFLSYFYLSCSHIRLPALVKQLPKLRDLTISEIIFDDDEVGHSTTFNLLVTHDQKRAKDVHPHALTAASTLPFLETIRMRLDVTSFHILRTCVLRTSPPTGEDIAIWTALVCKALASSNSPNALAKRVIVTHPNGTTSRLALQLDGHWESCRLEMCKLTLLSRRSWEDN